MILATTTIVPRACQETEETTTTLRGYETPIMINSFILLPSRILPCPEGQRKDPFGTCREVFS